MDSVHRDESRRQITPGLCSENDLRLISIDIAHTWTNLSAYPTFRSGTNPNVKSVFETPMTLFRLPFFILIAGTYACSGPSNPDPIDPADWKTPAGWTATEPTVCTSPIEAAWEDFSSRLEYPWGDVSFISEQTAAVIEDGEGFLTLVAAGTPVFNALDEEPVVLSTGDPILRLATFDLRQDGAEDILLMGEGVEIIWDYGAATEQTQTLIERVPFTAHRGPVIIDLDGDGYDDLLLMQAQGEEGGQSRGLWWRNTGDDLDGPLNVADPQDPHWGKPFDVRVMDFNGDSAPDIYLCNDFGATLGGNWLLLNDGQGGFASASRPDLELVTSCMGTSVGDTNADGELDIYVASAEVHFLLENAGDSFILAEEAAQLPIPSTGQMVWGSQIVDLDNDGLVDILAATSDFTVPDADVFPLWAMMGVGDGTFEERGEALGFPQEAQTRALVVRDMNSDGVPDVYFTDATSTPGLLFSKGCTADNYLVIEAPEGTRVQVVTDTSVRGGLSTAHPGFSASMRPEVRFGLGDEAVVQSLTIWPPWSDPIVVKGPFESRRTLRWSP
jgi:hypothetical protein